MFRKQTALEMTPIVFLGYCFSVTVQSTVLHTGGPGCVQDLHNPMWLQEAIMPCLEVEAKLYVLWHDVQVILASKCGRGGP